MNSEVRILILEDRPADAEMIQRELRKEGIQHSTRLVVKEKDFLAALHDFAPDLILADYSLPSYDGLSALAAVQKERPETPFLFVSGSLGEERAIEAMQHGATDYVLKQRLARLGPAVRRALREAGQRKDREEAEKRVRELNLLLRAIRDVNKLIVCERDPERLLADACRCLIQTRSYAFAWIGLAEPDSKSVNPVARAGEGAGYLEAATFTWDEAPTGQGPTGTAMRTGKPWTCQNTATDPRFGLWRRAALACGFASVTAVPMLRDDRVIGAITVYSGRVEAFHLEELDLLQELATDLAYALENIHHEKERQRAAASIEQSRSELAAIYDATPLMICLLNPARQIERINRTMAEFIGHPITLDAPAQPGDLLGCVHALDDSRGCGFGEACETCALRAAIINTFETGEPCRQVEAQVFLSQAGVPRRFYVSASTALVRLHDQPKVLVCLEDISQRKELETQLRQAQKMEAVGQLAGGVAHDFNNVLAVIRGNADLLLLEGGQITADAAEYLGEVIRGSESAANLTRQLLIFSRKQVAHAQPVRLNELIANLTRMLKRTIREDIHLECRFAEQLPCVQADPGMVEQVLLNLVVNARDAMPMGGQLEIVTRAVSLDAAYAGKNPEARAGEFVCLSVKDTGTGIAPEALPHIFEPFFTTKEIGKGTGLGLATVYGIVKQHQGWAEVDSRVGEGTTFKIFLPEVASPATSGVPQQARTKPPRGTETILLVEDNSPLRLVTRRVLEKFGYQVCEARFAREALEVWGQKKEQIALLLSDIVMPEGMTGRDLAEQLRAQKPLLKVILMSGHSAESLGKEKEFFQQSGTHFLQKPCRTDTLLQTVRKSLDEC